MAAPPRKLILWTGPRHSGKTAAAEQLVQAARQAGLAVAGLLAPSVYEAEKLLGFDAVDLATGARAPLARQAKPDEAEVGSYSFLSEGRELGARALSAAAECSADLIVVDEFGPLELRGRGWRDAVDSLLRTAGGAIVLVVRKKLTRRVRRLYPQLSALVVPARGPDAVKTVLDALGGR